MTDQIETLMTANLLEVFGERDPVRRREAIERTYTEDVSFLDPDEIVDGYDALDAKAGKLLEDAPGFVFSPAGRVYVNHDMGYLAWSFGPEGQPPVVRGLDACFIRDGRIAKVYTLLLAE
ncbi:nuclear transport factor 2 family protein [Rathayibacter sp. VKM Ac-2759]|uniref:nuclear transport factor 2 family protein n=1 Tax=Rathayibacter sp. VKM Ac-2759 TaxID=2609252 RepID=UPI0013170070|nr:nuclear transport factor 2 family protein [Rathayibacter sp. VKM Ac-2759]QHC68292.1 nuclear transport factor 2 family protein [Rathayibacter sp. VKM Ac-2759]